MEIEIDEYAILPNHIHSIIIIGDEYISFPTEDRTKMTLCKVLQQFKRACTMELKTKYIFNGILWQRSFYDRVIRNERELYSVRKYIIENPFKWEIEKDNIENLEL